MGVYIEPRLEIGVIENGYTLTANFPTTDDSVEVAPSVNDRRKTIFCADENMVSEKLTKMLPLLKDAQPDSQTQMKAIFEEAVEAYK